MLRLQTGGCCDRILDPVAMHPRSPTPTISPVAAHTEELACTSLRAPASTIPSNGIFLGRKFWDSTNHSLCGFTVYLVLSGLLTKIRLAPIPHRQDARENPTATQTAPG